MNSTRLVRVIVSIESMPASMDFYRDLLGLAVKSAGDEFATLCTRDDVEVLLHRRSTSPSDSSVSAGFLVSDLDGVVNRWRSGGGAVVAIPSTRPWGERMAVVRDPDGHVVCLIDDPRPEPSPAE